MPCGVYISREKSRYYPQERMVAEMEDGRKKIRICLISIVLAAVIIGVCYYYSSGETQKYNTEGTLIRRFQEECHVC